MTASSCHAGFQCSPRYMGGREKFTVLERDPVRKLPIHAQATKRVGKVELGCGSFGIPGSTYVRGSLHRSKR